MKKKEKDPRLIKPRGPLIPGHRVIKSKKQYDRKKEKEKWQKENT